MPRVKLQPEVQAFAEQMQAKLDANAHKGKSWQQDSIFDLWRRIGEEHVELARAIMANDPQAIMKEAADVANFVMMVHDNAANRFQPFIEPEDVAQEQYAAQAYVGITNEVTTIAENAVVDNGTH